MCVFSLCVYVRVCLICVRVCVYTCVRKYVRLIFQLFKHYVLSTKVRLS